jgi:hypothetical protein
VRATCRPKRNAVFERLLSGNWPVILKFPLTSVFSVSPVVFSSFIDQFAMTNSLSPISIPLTPQPKIWLRAAILAMLVLFIAIGQSSWFAKFGGCLMMAAWLGTFPRQRINSKVFEKEYFVCFVPIGIHRTRLTDVVRIETDVERRIGLSTGILLSLFLGVINIICIRLLDWLFPWAGGDYKLWLQTKSDGRVLAWQGNGEENFKNNLDILQETTDLPIARG